MTSSRCHRASNICQCIREPGSLILEIENTLLAMSRRKQSNPKPIKRLSDGEDDSEMSEKLSLKDETDMETDSPLSTVGMEKMKETGNEQIEIKLEQNSDDLLTEKDIKSELSSESVKCEQISKSVSPNEMDFLKSVNVPNEVLFLKRVDDEDASHMGRSYLVCSSIPLPAGSCIGPFRGELVSLSSIKQEDLVLQAQDRGGDAGFVRVLEESGSWLSLLRPAPSDSAKNASVYFEDDKIWCEVVSDLVPGTELLASFTINSDSDEDTHEDDMNMDQKSEIKVEPPSPKLSPKVSDHQQIPSTPTNAVPTKSQANHAALLYGCPFCGVRFSSGRTLQGHLTYYCSKKPVDMLGNMQEDGEINKESADVNQHPDKRLKLKRKSSESPDHKHSDRSSSTSDDDGRSLDSPTAKAVKTGEIYHCSHCSYSTDKIQSLNRHKRIHDRGDNSQADSNVQNKFVDKGDTYCKECNIQFSSMSTYKCHKDIYCSNRPSANDGSSNSSTSPGMINATVDLASHAFSRPPASLQQAMLDATNASVLPGQTRVILAPPIVAPKGVADMGYPTVIVQPVVAPPPSSSASSNSSHKTCSDEGSASPDQPLDLSTSKGDSKSVLKSPKLSTSKSTSEDGELDLSIKIKREPVSPVISTNSKTPPTPVMSPKAISPRSSKSGERTPTSLQHMLSPGLPLMGVHHLPFINNIRKPIQGVPPSVSKCVDCNIVFYKRENYLIHKKHYCSSRRNKSCSADEDVDKEGSDESQSGTSLMFNSTKMDAHTPTEDPTDIHSTKSPSPSLNSPKTPKSESSENTNEVGSVRSEKIMYRFYCVPCKIKFSSASTLKAHKEFYCPHGKESGQTIIAKKPVENHDETSRESDDGTARCSSCDGVFASSRLLKLHFCTGLSSHAPLLRCIYCDFVTQTEVRLSEHMKAHMPNKAYRCTLCGYRGNTVRGMRMHGKMHIDKGEEFTDENMLEIEEPPLMPVKQGVIPMGDSGPLDVEAELIRLKNEPYKRRRSRKSYEKSEHAASVPVKPISSMCMFCGQIFTDVSNFAMHLKLHEMIALQAAGQPSLKCQYCDSICETFEKLMSHVYHKHPEKIPREHHSPGSHSESSRSNSRSSTSNSRPRSTESPNNGHLNGPSKENNDPEIETDNIKKEVVDNEYQTEETVSVNASDVRIKEEVVDEVPISPEEGKNAKDAENIPAKLSTNDASKNPETTNKRSPVIKEEIESLQDSVRSPLETSRENTDSVKSGSPSPRSLKSPGSRGSTPKIKNEHVNGIDKKVPPLVVPRIDSHMMPYYQVMPNFNVIPSTISNGQGPVTPFSPKSEKQAAKYCKHCDISFTYQATYLAHKKYYCTASIAETMPSPTKT